MTTPSDAFEAAVLIGRSLEAHQVPYAIGGALAYGQYGVPRATNDVDVNVFVEPDGLEPVRDALAAVGVATNASDIANAIARDGMFVVRLAEFRVDVFTPSIEFSREAERTRVRQTVDGVGIWFLSAEALCVFKLLFFRSKDIADLERLIAVYGDRLDGGYVRTHLVDMMGADDPRIARWDQLWAEFRPT
jgi:hypothetical protein